MLPDTEVEAFAKWDKYKKQNKAKAKEISLNTFFIVFSIITNSFI